MRRVFDALIVEYPGEEWTSFPQSELTKVVRVDDLRYPISLCLGAIEALSMEELDEIRADLEAERARR